jgi:hypothetical protein
LLDNAARPSGALVYEPGEAGATLSRDQFDRLKAEMEASFSGAVNAGKPMLLEGGLRWQAMSLSPTDMDFLALKSNAAREIALAFGVPPMLLGLPGDATYANYREANRALFRLAILPLAGKLLDAIGEGLRTWFPGATLTIDLDAVGALAEDRERLWAQVSGVDFLTLDEKRALVGYDAVAVPEMRADAPASTDEPVPADAPPEPDPADPAEVKYNHCHNRLNGQFTFANGACSDGSSSAQMASRPKVPAEKPGSGRTVDRRAIVNKPTMTYDGSDMITVQSRSNQAIRTRDGRTITNSATATYRAPGLNGKGYVPADGDANLLARIMYAESLSNPEDFAAIGWATVNRVGERQHGATLHAVIHKRNAFEVLEVGGGPKGNTPQWNETEEPSKLEGIKFARWNQVYAAAEGILGNRIADPTGGATYFISSPTYVRGDSRTTDGFFARRIKAKQLIDSPYISASSRKRKNHFFIEVPLPPTPPKKVKHKL